MSQIKNQRKPNDAAIIDLHQFMLMKERKAGRDFKFEVGNYLRDLGFKAVVYTEAHKRGK